MENGTATNDDGTVTNEDGTAKISNGATTKANLDKKQNRDSYSSV